MAKNTKKNDGSAVENFDVDSWMAQGKAALESLEERREVVAAELAELDSEIKGIRSSLGLKKPRKSRMRLRPVIMDMLAEASGAEVSFESFLSAVQEANEGREVDLPTVIDAVKRAAKDEPKITVSDTGATLTE